MRTLGEYDQEVDTTIVLESSLVQYTTLDDGREEGLAFNISDTTIKDLLYNVTVSVISLGYWNTSTIVTRADWVNTYSFSGFRRYSLILPYALSLLLSLAFVVIGLLSLFENSVAASNGFLQIIQTSRGSAALDHAARGSSLGGPENVPSNLENLELMFGELKRPAGGEGPFRRAGWGTRSEVGPLVKGESYTG